MKRLLLILLLAVTMFSLFAEQMLHKTLPNGLEIVVKENFTNNSVAVYCYLRTGSIHEEEYIGMGLSHVLEHLISGGSSKFHTEKEYLEAGRRMGAITNASTWRDGVNYYMQVDKQYADEAVKQLAEQVGYAKLEKSEMDRELKVIEKEIVMRSTPPMSQIYQRMNELFYPDTPYRYPVIGFTDRLRNINHDILVDYYKRRHSPENMIVVVCGNFKAEEMMITVEKEWGTLKQQGRLPLAISPQGLLEGENLVVQEFDVKQATLTISYQLPEFAQLDQSAIEASLDYLMQRRNSPISYRLVEKEKLCSRFSGYYSKNRYLPNPNIMIRCVADSAKNLPRILEILDEEIAKASRKSVPKKDLVRLVSTIKASQMLETPDADTEAQEIAETLLSGSLQPDNTEEMIRNFEKLTVQDLNEAITKYLVPKNRVIFMAVPLGEAKLLQKQETSSNVKGEIAKVSINQNLTLLHRKNNRKPLVQGVLWFPMSREYETTAMAGSIDYMANLVMSGPTGRDPLKISEWLEERSIRYRISSGRYGTALSFTCLKTDYPELKKLFKDSFAKPAFAQSEIDRNRQSLLSRSKNQQTNAGSMHDEFLNTLIFPDRRESVTIAERTKHLVSLTPDSLRALYQQYFKTDRAFVTFFGDVEKEEASEMAKELAGFLPKGNSAGLRINNDPILDGKTHVNKYNFEPVNVSIDYPAPTHDSPDFTAFQVVNCLLNGSRGRLHEATRGANNNLAYFASSQHDWNTKWGILEVSSQTSADKKDALVTTLAGEVQKLVNGEVTAEEIALAVQEQKKIWESFMGDNNLPDWLTNYEVNGLGWEYLFNGYKELEKVTPEQVKAVSAKYLKTPTIFISEPNDTVKRMVD